MKNRNSRRIVRNATANALPFERLEDRRLMAATAVKSIDSNGPDFSIVETNGKIYAISSTGSGAGQNQIWVTDGPKGTSKVLVDTSKSGSKISSLDDLTVTTDGRVLFTANAPTGGRQLFQIDTKNGYKQLTAKTGAYYDVVQTVGNKIFAYDSTKESLDTFNSKGKLTTIKTDVDIEKMFAAKGMLFFVLTSDDGLWRTDGSSGGTFKVSADYSFGASKVFGTGDYVYFNGSKNNNTSLYRVDGSNAAPVKIADDFTINNNTVAEAQDATYVSGMYYNTSPKDEDAQIYKITTLTGEIEKVGEIVQANGGAAPTALALIGDSVYYNSNDGDYLNTEGTYDQELFRYDISEDKVYQVTDDETLVPVGVGAGVLSNYYFIAAPEKVGSRFGERRVYRTNPQTDEIEPVGGVPSYEQSAGVDKQDIRLFTATTKGLFFSARNNDKPGDFDIYQVATPFSSIDSVTKTITIDGTNGNDNLAIKRVGSNLVMTLNGTTETQSLSGILKINVSMKDGNDKVVTAATVNTAMNIYGDGGDDSLQGGSGNDYILTGAGKNTAWGGAGDDKLKGAAGVDKLYGEDGADVGSSRVDLQACKLEYSIVSPK